MGNLSVQRDGEAPVGVVRLRSRGTLLRLLAQRSVAFGEGYADGSVGVEGDLVGVLRELSLAASRRGARVATPCPDALRRLLRNTRGRSRDNIHQHYDLGNDFYRLWLDERMLYTCAYYPQPGLTLEAAQQAKIQHVCLKLRLRPGQHVVEAGCGWGALAMHMAERFGVTVRAFNISREQVAYARERARERGLDGRVTFVEEDYRAIPEHCRNSADKADVFVSVGMLEHVGPERYRGLGRIIDACLAPGGKGLIHTIGRHRPMPVDAWIARRIFPGGEPPSLGQMMRIFEPHGLAVLDVENLRLHYAQTLRQWLERFEAQRQAVTRMFDERFVRAWRLYLAGSQAAFETGWMQLFQVVFARHDDNDLPMRRRA